MDKLSKEKSPSATPILLPYEPAEFWQSIRLIVREEITRVPVPATPSSTQTLSTVFETPGMVYKPLYKMSEVCQLFQVTKPTIYDWCRHGKLKPIKIRSRVFFLWDDLKTLIS